jgi:hypothetical protein
MKKCRSYEKYQGKVAPKCNKGDGCEACWERFRSRCSHPLKDLTLIEKKNEFGDTFVSRSYILHCGRCLSRVQNWDNNILFLWKKLFELKSSVTTHTYSGKK